MIADAVAMGNRARRIARSGGGVMKRMVLVLIALTALAGVAAPAGAVDAKTFYEQLDRAHY